MQRTLHTNRATCLLNSRQKPSPALWLPPRKQNRDPKPNQPPSMKSKLLFFLVLLSLLTLSSSLPSKTLLDAAEILSDSGRLSMALTLQLVSDFLTLQSSSLTIFSPSDTIFVGSGQPSLSLLQFQFSPFTLSLDSLKSLSPGTKIPTLLYNRSLTVTSLPSDGDQVSLNGVKINGSIYDDGSLVIFGIDKFFDPDFENLEPVRNPNLSVECAASMNRKLGLKGAVEALRSRGYNFMASFLDSQLVGFDSRTFLTVFAPVDELTMIGYISNYSYCPSIFMSHVVPCKISLRDLTNFGDGTVLETYLEGFEITVVKSGDVLMLNEVPIAFPDMYKNEWVVVHGLDGILDA